MRSPALAVQLSPVEHQVLRAIADATDAGRIAYPAQLAQALGLDQAIVQQAIDQLLFLGFVADGDGGMN